jgi:hypothetical protein
MTNNIDQKLQALRLKWKKHPEQRDLIERQAKALKYSLEPYRVKSEQEHESLVSNVIESLLE